ncbi:MAG TPA: outer membrane beta-barrel protein [Pyrinomonadaceae bacterium]|jgi:hypothetical protein
MSNERSASRPLRGTLFSSHALFYLRAAAMMAALLCLWPSNLEAQQQPPATSRAEAENAELRRRLQELEQRLKMVEEELQRSQQGLASAGPAKKSEQTNANEAAQTPDSQTPPQAEDEDKAEQKTSLLDFFKKTQVSGFIDTYYAYNFNRPANRVNAFRSFDSRHHQFAFNVAEIAFEKTPEEDSRFGFRVDLDFGPAADFLSGTEPGGVEVYKHFQQVYGSYLAPVGKGLKLDFGKFISWSGAEVDEAQDNWNYSRGLLYTVVQPAYHMGLQTTYDFNERVSLAGAVVNGWNNVEENNRGKTYGLALTYKPISRLTFTQNYTGGPEQDDDDRNWRHFFDTILSYNINDRLKLMGNYDYGFDRLADGSGVRWQGVAAYLRYQAAKRFAISPRFEWYKDYDGFTTGTRQRLSEVTLTGEYKMSDNFLTRLEYRRDWSDQAVFQRSDPASFSRNQTTLVGGFIWSFSTGEEESSAHLASSPTAPQPSSTGPARAVVERANTQTTSTEKSKSAPKRSGSTAPSRTWGDNLPPQR